MRDGGQLGTPEEAMSAGGASQDLEAHAPRRVDKPWGYEIIWAETVEYVGKLLHVHAGEAFSLQFHEEKDETLFLLDGEVDVEVGNGVNSLRSIEFFPGSSLRLRPGTLHRIQAVTDATILEASTPELDDVVRVQDRYGRVGDGPAVGS